MVFQENVVSWFRKLSSYKRIDVMCTLMNMCLPFEVRYLGTYIEDIGKRDYNEFRDTEYRANNTTELNDLSNLGLVDTKTRRKLVLYMALLHGNNHPCALVHYKSLLNNNVNEITNVSSGTGDYNQDEQALEELLLLFTMALNHPAFTFEQKSTIGNIYQKLQDEEQSRLNFSKSIINSTNKTTEFCGSCAVPSDRPIDETPSNCVMPSPLIQPHPVNPVNSWPNPMMMGNQMVYPEEIFTCPSSTQVDRQESPLQSRLPSRSNSPLLRRNNNTSFKPSFESQSVPSSHANVTTANTNSLLNNNLNPNINPINESSFNQQLTTNRNVSSQLEQNNSDTMSCGSTKTSNSLNIPISSSSSSSNDKISSNKQQQLPKFRDNINADFSKDKSANLKGNLQNFSLEEFRKMSDEDLKELGLTPNAVGQLRNIIKNQATNGNLHRAGYDNKVDNSQNVIHHNKIELPESEHLQSVVNVSSDNWTPSTMYNPQQQQQQQQPIHHSHGHMSNIRPRYPTMLPTDSSQIPVYIPPPPLPSVTMGTPGMPCYACFSKTIGNMQNHYPKCIGQHMYCLAQLQSLQLDPASGRHCSQSSSSDSSESRSPPETPPAAPWSTNAPLTTTTTTTTTTTSSHITSNNKINSVGDNSVTTEHNVCSTIQAPPQLVHTGMQNVQSNIQQIRERSKNHKKNSHIRRQKNHNMNGGLPHMSHCVPGFSISGQPMYSQVGFRSPGQFPLRPNIYSTFPHTLPRPNYPTNYQPNGEIIYTYPGQSVVANTQLTTSTGIVPPTAQAYIPPPVPTFTHTAKISCHNCGSLTHVATDCKEKEIEDLTRKAQYRLDYSANQLGESSNNDK